MIGKPFTLEELFLDLKERGHHIGLMKFVLNLIEN
jgi:hypothetical protein